MCSIAHLGLALVFEGAHDWARDTLILHARDKREYLYDLQQLEQGKTHDQLWNAAQVPACPSRLRPALGAAPPRAPLHPSWCVCTQHVSAPRAHVPVGPAMQSWGSRYH